MEANANNAQEDTGVSEGQTDLKYSRFCVHDWVVDPKVGHISHTGETIRLEPKVMDVLVYLAERPGEAVTRAELEETVWADVVVSYETLTSTIQKLRKAFHDDAHAPRFIETLPKRGYRLVAPVRSLDDAATAPDNHGLATRQPDDGPGQDWRPMMVGAVVLVMVGIAAGLLWLDSRQARFATSETAPSVMSAKPSIAILPFKNMSDDKDQEYFSDGLTGDLITDLSKISNMTVISRTSTSGYKGKEIDVRDVGTALNVKYVLEGSVRKIGGRVRINVQLIDAATGGNLWAERYDGTLDDIFGLQDRVLEKIVGSLALTLSEHERQRMAAKGTNSVVAHDLYLQGLFEESAFSRTSNVTAVKLYEQALSIDPDYALPYARLSNILQSSARNGWSENVHDDLQQAVQLAEKAVALDEQNPELYWILGRAVGRIHMPGAVKRGIKSMERAIELDTDFADAYAFLGLLYVGDGRAEDGLRSVQTAMRLNPHYPFWYLYMRGITQFMLKDTEKAIADYEAALERSPTALFVRIWLAAAYATVGRLDDAEWQVGELMSMGFDGNIRTITSTQPIQHPPYLASYIKALRQAGFAE